MKLDIFVADRHHRLDVPPDVLADGEAFFRKMDEDMDRGWQMGPDFIEHPNRLQRCQIAAARLLNALVTAREASVMLMAGYILTRLPGVTGVHIDTSGDMTQTEFVFDRTPEPAVSPAPCPAAPAPSAAGTPAKRLSKLEALDQAGKEVSKVYRCGKGYRFAVLDRTSGQWVESALLDDERDASAARMLAFRRRYEELLAAGGADVKTAAQGGGTRPEDPDRA